MDNHAEWGVVARQRLAAGGRVDIFEGLTESQIRARVGAAWGRRELMESQVDVALGVTRQRYRGVDPVSGRTVEFWFNTNTRIVETAYQITLGIGH